METVEAVPLDGSARGPSATDRGLDGRADDCLDDRRRPVIQLLLSRAADNDVDEVLHQRADAAVAVITDASATSLTVPQDSLEPGISSTTRTATVLAGSVGSNARDVADELAGTDREQTSDGPGGVARLLAVPFDTPSGESGVLVVSQDTTPYERSERYALYATGILAVLVIATTALFALRVTRQALEPVARMAQRAAEWSERDLTRGSPSDRPPTSSRRWGRPSTTCSTGWRRRSCPSSGSPQSWRTSCARRSRRSRARRTWRCSAASPTRPRQDLEQISASARGCRRRSRPCSTWPARTLRGWTATPPSSPTWSVRCARWFPTISASLTRPAMPAPSPSLHPGPLALRALAPLIENACAHATSEVSLSARREGHQVALSVTDDGVGIDAALRERLFEPGTSAGAAAGLGLGIARRTARSLGGDVVVEPAERTTFTVRLQVA